MTGPAAIGPSAGEALGPVAAPRQPKAAAPQPVQAYEGPLPEGYDMRTSEVLNKAADLIEKRGWKTGGYYGAELCLESALAIAHDGTTGRESWDVANTCPAGRAVRSYLHMAEWDGWSGSLWTWNDMQDDATRVIEVLRAAALTEAAREDAALLAEAGRV